MQFRRVQENLQQRGAVLPHVDLERIRATVAHEYEQFVVDRSRNGRS